MKIVKNNVIKIIRILIGIFFVFSGLVKLNDPLGLSFKLQDYFAGDVFDIPFLIPYANILSFLLILIEINLGLMFIVGFAINKIRFYVLGLIIFFGFITFYSAYFNKVTDCGCFGDAIPLSPWQSFYKNFILLIILLVFWKKWNPKNNMNKYNFMKMFSLVNVFCVGILIYVMNYLPILDFRPFAQGKPLSANINNTYNENEIRWLYRVDEETKEFKTEDQPWNIPNAVYLDRIQKKNDFDIASEFIIFYNGNKFTDSLINMDKFIMVIIYKSKGTNNKGIEKIKTIFNNLEYKIPLIFVFGDEDMHMEAIYGSKVYNMYSDRTLLKTIIRANPGILLVKKNKIIKKWSWRGISKEDLHRQLEKL